MQKIKVLVCVILAGVTLMACTPNKEKLIRQYEEACQKGDAVKADRIAEKLEQAFDEKDFDETEVARILKAQEVMLQKMEK